MNAKEEATQEIRNLIIDVINIELFWLPLRKKIVNSERIRRLAERIMNISEKYVSSRLEQQHRMLCRGVFELKRKKYGP